MASPQPKPNVPSGANPPDATPKPPANNQEGGAAQCGGVCVAGYWTRRRKRIALGVGIGVLAVIIVIILIAALTVGSAPNFPPHPKGWQKDSLDAHNAFRTKHGVPNLTLSDELNESAQKCADYLAGKKIMRHICQKDLGHKNGENLYASNRIKDNHANTESVSATEAWYSEEPKHDYNKNVFDPNSGHFTQVVWKETKRLGMGYRQNGDFTIVVGHYDPPGNFDGEQTKMVPRPI